MKSNKTLIMHNLLQKESTLPTDCLRLVLRWRRARINPAWNKHLHYPEMAILIKCYKIWTRHTTEVKVGSMESSWPKESKEVNLTSVVCLFQKL